MLQVTTGTYKVRVLTEGKEAWILQLDEVQDRTKVGGMRGLDALSACPAAKRQCPPCAWPCACVCVMSDNRSSRVASVLAI